MWEARGVLSYCGTFVRRSSGRKRLLDIGDAPYQEIVIGLVAMPL